MDIFGTTISISLGSWRLRFVLALEDDAGAAGAAAVARPPHHLAVHSRHHLEA